MQIVPVELSLSKHANKPRLYVTQDADELAKCDQMLLYLTG